LAAETGSVTRQGWLLSSPLLRYLPLNLLRWLHIQLQSKVQHDIRLCVIETIITLMQNVAIQFQTGW